MKARLLRKDRLKPGAAPGTFNPPKDALPSDIHVIAYDTDNIEELSNPTIAQIKELQKKWPVVWVNVNGLGSVDVIQALGDLFKLHMLALEDVVNLGQRAKTEDYQDFIFTITRMAMTDAAGGHALEQFSLFLGRNFILTFQERPGDVFDPVRERLRKGGRRIRMEKADYMAYALLDAVVDGYFPILEKYGDLLDRLEDAVLDNPTQDHMEEIHKTKRELQILRHCIWPMRESVNKIGANTKLVSEETTLFLRDCQDHVIQVLDLLETYRERISGLTDLYLSSISNKMNEVMKVLTIIATIFMPLGFLAGVYGMNFDTSSPYNMPELSKPYGYPVLIGVMLLIALIMLGYFRKLGWLGGRKG